MTSDVTVTVSSLSLSPQRSPAVTSQSLLKHQPAGFSLRQTEGQVVTEITLLSPALGSWVLVGLHYTLVMGK